MDSAAAGTREITVTVAYFEGDTVRTVLERAGGLLPWADARNCSIERRDGEKLKRLPVDGHAIMVMRDLSKDVPVRAGDVVLVPAEREAVMVSGPVHRPGLYSFSPLLKPEDYIKLAGGPTPQGKVAGSKVISKDGARSDIAKAPPISPGDTIAVKQRVLSTYEWVQILIAATSLLLSATAIAITLKK
jgi:protein involved in polysaccharide export with SLBB domain